MPARGGRRAAKKFIGLNAGGDERKNESLKWRKSLTTNIMALIVGGKRLRKRVPLSFFEARLAAIAGYI